jgi:hypothetical protein
LYAVGDVVTLSSLPDPRRRLLTIDAHADHDMIAPLPIELWQAVLEHAPDSLLLPVSLVCHAWRISVFERLFGSLTILVEDGPWKDPGYAESPALIAIAPHARRLRVTAANETESPESWETTTIFQAADVAQLARVLPSFPNLRILDMKAICFECDQDMDTLVKAVGNRLQCLELDDVKPYGSPRDPGVETRSATSPYHLRYTLRKFQLSHMHFLRHFLKPGELSVTDLELCLATQEGAPISLGANLLPRVSTNHYSSRAIAPFMTNRKIERLTMTASGPKHAWLMSLILASHSFTVLSHLVLGFDLEHTAFPVGDGEPRAAEPSSTLRRVDLVFLSCTPQLIQDHVKQKSFRRGMSFLRKCDEKGIAIHTTFREKRG